MFYTISFLNFLKKVYESISSLYCFENYFISKKLNSTNYFSVWWSVTECYCQLTSRDWYEYLYQCNTWLWTEAFINIMSVWVNLLNRRTATGSKTKFWLMVTHSANFILIDNPHNVALLIYQNCFLYFLKEKEAWVVTRFSKTPENDG